MLMMLAVKDLGTDGILLAEVRFHFNGWTDLYFNGNMGGTFLVSRRRSQQYVESSRC